jgi:YD repeat-containing protein
LVALVVALLAVAPQFVRLDSTAKAGTEPQSTAQEGHSSTITYTYDGAGRLVRADYGEGRCIVYTYDAAGNLLRRQVVTKVDVYLPIVLKAA